MKMYRAGRILKFGLIAAAAVGAVSAIVMELWNLLLPAILGVRAISFWQALGLLVLSKLLFGGFRPGRPGGGQHWRRRMFERWEKMTPEERERFKGGMRRGACGFRPERETRDAGASEAQT